ncbi:uncharacterized protein LOC135101626 isoform X2 [Scylla paramamosain]|uniref:uncharacterized protein LOC135101626 isoform X2 n=1 Tax=Scylla paramamosain TaxID=85552 RepID=UPI003082F36C
MMMIPAFILIGANETNLGLYSGLTLYAIGVASILAVTAGSLVPLMFLKEVMKRYDSSKGLRCALINVFSATSEWSPKDPALRQEYRNQQNMSL